MWLLVTSALHTPRRPNWRKSFSVPPCLPIRVTDTRIDMGFTQDAMGDTNSAQLPQRSQLLNKGQQPRGCNERCCSSCHLNRNLKMYHSAFTPSFQFTFLPSA